MGDFITYEKIPERAVLIAVASKQQGRERTEEYLDELAFLLETAGGVPVARFVQPLDHPSSVSYLGSGKLEEIHQYIKAENIEIAVIDATTWTNTYEADGAMFLPAAGQRDETDVEDVGGWSYYWSSTPSANGNNAYELLISSSYVSAASNTDNYSYGNSVRLAR